MRPRPAPIPPRIRLAIVAGLALIASTPARAHFLWLKAGLASGRPEVRGFLSETPTPDDADLLKTIAATRLSAGGKPLTWIKEDDTYLVKADGTSSVDGACDLGLKARGGTSFLLLYTARAQFGPTPVDEPSGPDDGLRLRLVARVGKAPAVVALFRGKPAAGVGVKSFVGDDPAIELTSGTGGIIDAPAVVEGKAGLLAKWVEPARGERDGKPYTEIRHYATLTVAPSPAPSLKAASGRPFAPLAVPVNSFGAAVVGDWLYVYSGHVGETHKYHVGTTSPHFRRLNLVDRTTWEDLPAGPSLQGLALVGHGGTLYRVGGMAARNLEGAPNDLASTAGFARFDPASKTWTDLPPLPAPRSTHDAVVVGDTLHVVGGWSMPGGPASEAEFVDDAVAIDLADPSKGWRTLPTPPFRRRALAVASSRGRIYALGGLDESGAVVKAVDVYDPAAQTWSRGPDLPFEGRQGFAPSAFEVDGRLVLSGSDGRLLALSPKGDSWAEVGRLATPRMSHRLVAGIDHDSLIVGGTAARTSIGSIESIRVEDPTD